MKTIHADNLRVWSGVDAFSTVPGWGDATKQNDGTFIITPESREALRKDVAALAWEGINGKRMLPYAGWLLNGMQTAEECLTPYILENGKFNLDKRNPSYWPIVKEILAIFKFYNVEMIYCLFDNCQYWHNPTWACWANNVQSLENYMQDIARSKLWAQEVVSEIGGFDNVLFEVVNEGVEWGGIPNAKNWFRTIFGALKDGGIDADRVSVGTNLERGNYLGNGEFKGDTNLQEWCKSVAEEIWGEKPAWGVYLPVHGVTGDVKQWNYNNIWHNAPELTFGQFYHQPMWYWAQNSAVPRRFYLSNDGLKDKDSVQARETWKQMCGDAMKNYQLIHPVTGHKLVFEMECDGAMDIRIEGVKKMAEGIGVQNLVNYHKIVYEPEVPPECKIGETKIEPCWDGSTIITHTCVNSKWTPTGNVCSVKPAYKCGKNKWNQHLKPWGGSSWNFKAAFAHLIGKHNW
jgi:hypothetical protein